MKSIGREWTARGVSHLERELLEGGRLFAGVDEVGRGPLAGPVVAAAVVWDYRINGDGIRDSKLLTASRRRELFSFILSKAISVSVAWSSPAEIDAINILNATLLAMSRAIETLERTPDLVLLDGNREIKSLRLPQKAIVKGDALIVAISAASIVAKVARDELMTRFDEIYPGYGFRSNFGYPTNEHRAALRKLGPCAIHRRSFKGVLDEK